LPTKANPTRNSRIFYAQNFPMSVSQEILNNQ
jgi:hypothetical protein